MTQIDRRPVAERVPLRFVALGAVTCLVIFEVYRQTTWANGFFFAAGFLFFWLAVEGPTKLVKWWRRNWEELDHDELEALREIHSRGHWS